MGSRLASKGLVLVSLSLLALAACSSTGSSTKKAETDGSAAPRTHRAGADTASVPHPGAAPPAAGGIYKIGKPYKVMGKWYYPSVQSDYDETGVASWYGPKFHGKRTANGERYDQHAMTAAHKTLPLPSWVEVTNLNNNKSIIVRVNDRGPYAHNRIIDMSKAGADKLGFLRAGTAPVRVRVVAGPKGGTVAAARPALKPAKQAPQTEPVAASDHPPRLFVQVGAFSDPINAKSLADRLGVTLGPRHSIMLSRALVEGREITRVRLGPLSDVDQADHALAEVLSQGYAGAHIIVD